MTRQPKTPRQRAEHALAVEEARLKAIGKKRADTKAALDRNTRDLERLVLEYDAAVVRRDHAKRHPDLAPTPGKSTTTPTTGPNATGGNPA